VVGEHALGQVARPWGARARDEQSGGWMEVDAVGCVDDESAGVPAWRVAVDAREGRENAADEP